jgi:hypothetical protein
MVSFFDKVGTGEAAGYGWKGVPKAPPGSAERAKKARMAREAAEAAVGT